MDDAALAEPPARNGHPGQAYGTSLALAAERLIGSIGRECVDHLVVASAPILRAYARYYNDIRIHWSLAKDAPVSRPIQWTGIIRSQAILADFITTT